ncbi:LacI family transcriptional regulator [Psychromicrobium silvestre]|uniref:LacI family transcriptional regulator n=1 Tax=Psychromicrobium silvestre TaxID=1645614 RepID=A0A7Y9LU87_9MICC|nr:LacI family DNA-binding transcriptional regulator [Psychromicrobium silvestre]NYE95669.1 LacI family transcriptional regulator [Psychromicrobium silvestre]
MSEKTPTVYDVAAHAGVSIATVSRVLRRPDDVREATRAKVLASVRELGYLPSASARGLAARRTGVIGIFFPGFDAAWEIPALSDAEDGLVRMVRDSDDQWGQRPPDLYFDAVLRGAELEAWRRGLVLMVGVGRGADPEAVVRDIAGRVDGLVVLARSVPDEVLSSIAHRIPVTLLAGPRRGDDFDHVSVANSEGMRALTQHLISTLGVSAPRYVGGPADSPDDVERYAGYCEALRLAGVDPATVPPLRAEFRREIARELAQQLLAEGTLPRALICANDQMALGILDVLNRAGIAVPGEVIVTGFDGIDAGRASVPPLTTVFQPMETLGREAVRMMADRLDAPESEPVSKRLPVTVLLRGSSEG